LDHLYVHKNSGRFLLLYGAPSCSVQPHVKLPLSRTCI